MSEQPQRVWNYRATVGGIAFATPNFVGAWLVINGTLTWTEFMAGMGAIDMLILGALFKDKVQ